MFPRISSGYKKKKRKKRRKDVLGTDNTPDTIRVWRPGRSHQGRGTCGRREVSDPSLWACPSLTGYITKMFLLVSYTTLKRGIPPLSWDYSSDTIRFFGSFLESKTSNSRLLELCKRDVFDVSPRKGQFKSINIYCSSVRLPRLLRTRTKKKLLRKYM